MLFTIEQQSKIVKFYLETKSLVQTQTEYRKNFGVKQAPSSMAIKKIVQNLEMHGTCHNRKCWKKSDCSHQNEHRYCAEPKKINTKAFI